MYAVVNDVSDLRKKNKNLGNKLGCDRDKSILPTDILL